MSKRSFQGVSVRESVAVFTGLLLLWGIFCLLTVQGQIAGFNWGDAVYLLMADAYLGRLAEYPAVYETVFSWRDYPPLYPLLISAFGGGVDGIDRAFIANALTHITVEVNLVSHSY